MSGRISVAQLRELATARTRGFIPIDEWGPKCAGCGGDEFRLDGYCSLECRDWHSDEDFEPVLALLEAVEAARQALTHVSNAITATPALDENRDTHFELELARQRLVKLSQRFDFGHQP